MMAPVGAFVSPFNTMADWMAAGPSELSSRPRDDHLRHHFTVSSSRRSRSSGLRGSGGTVSMASGCPNWMDRYTFSPAFTGKRPSSPWPSTWSRLWVQEMTSPSSPPMAVYRLRWRLRIQGRTSP